MNEIEEEAIDLRFSLHKVRQICSGNAENPSFRKKAQNEFSALADYIGCLLLKDKDKREEALLRWAEQID